MKRLFFLLFLSFVLSQDCSMTVPSNPLSATGLATAYQVQAPCNATDPNMASFVQGAIYDPNTHIISVYNPLVISAGTTPLVNPTVPTFNANAIVALWFGTNAGTLTLVDTAGSLTQGNCVNGLPGSIFGQFAYCNAPTFFGSVNSAIGNKLVVVPPLGIANDGLPCPTVRDFFVIDMDQSDNVVTSYLAVGFQTAQDTAANRKSFPNAAVLTNASDNRLLAIAMDSALACTPWMVPDLANPGSSLASFPMNELHATYVQNAPVALVPLSHAMARVNNQPSLAKVNAYRGGCGQPTATVNANADTVQYCVNVYYTFAKRLQMNEVNFVNAGSPDPAAATNLWAFLAFRFSATFGVDGLDCLHLLNVPSPVIPIVNGNGLVVSATITVPIPPATPAPAGLSQGSVAAIVIMVLFSVVVIVVGVFVVLRWQRVKYWFQDRFPALR